LSISLHDIVQPFIAFTLLLFFFLQFAQGIAQGSLFGGHLGEFFAVIAGCWPCPCALPFSLCLVFRGALSGLS
jgi:hypothetical protein